MTEKREVVVNGSTVGVISTGSSGVLHSSVTSLPADVSGQDDTDGWRLRSPRIFVSHAHDDADLAGRLVAVLRHGLCGIDAADLRCTSQSAHGLLPGEQLSSTLRSNVTAARAVVGLLTPHSLASPYVLFELGAAWGAGVPIVAVRVGTARSAGPLDEYLSVSPTDEDAVEGLVLGVARAAGLQCERMSAFRPATRALLEMTRHTRVPER